MSISAQSEARVASRFLRARGWDDPQKLISDYRKALEQFDEVVETERSKGKPNDLILGPYGFIPTAIAGRQVAEWALQTRKIPLGKEKFLELASRALMAARRAPRNIIVWYDKNKSWLQFLLEATTWPDREESGEGAQAALAGKFKVHNTIGAGGFVPRKSVRKILEEMEIHKKFPTKYSAKDVYEFFAELFAFYSLGKLAPELVEGFEGALHS